jgi:hypothetical protein
MQLPTPMSLLQTASFGLPFLLGGFHFGHLVQADSVPLALLVAVQAATCVVYACFSLCLGVRADPKRSTTEDGRGINWLACVLVGLLQYATLHMGFALALHAGYSAFLIAKLAATVLSLNGSPSDRFSFAANLKPWSVRAAMLLAFPAAVLVVSPKVMRSRKFRRCADWINRISPRRPWDSLSPSPSSRWE